MTSRLSSFVTLQREREGERGALADLALHPDLAAVQLDELPRERQPEARALVLLRVIGPDLTELLEDGLLILERDAHAGVAHRDFGDAVRGRSEEHTSELQ